MISYLICNLVLAHKGIEVLLAGLNLEGEENACGNKLLDLL